jgi:hypothetical protein
MAVVEDGLGRHVVPTELVVQKDTLLEADSPARRIPSMRSYRAFDDQIQATTVFIAGSTAERGRLLETRHVAGGPAGTGFRRARTADKITSAMTDLPPDNHMTVTQDGRRTDPDQDGPRRSNGSGAATRPAPSAPVTRWASPLSGEKTEVTVVLGDEACPQASQRGWPGRGPGRPRQGTACN